MFSVNLITSDVVSRHLFCLLTVFRHCFSCVVETAREYGCQKWRPCSRAVDTGIEMCGNGFLWSLYGIRQAIIFLPCGFFLLLLSFFIPRLISAAANWMSTILLHLMPSANLECISEMFCTQLAGNAGPKNRQKFAIWGPLHNWTLSVYIFATKAL